MYQVFRYLCAAFVACCYPHLSCIAYADDLHGALEQAYRSNPVLEKAHNNLRASKEGVLIARASGRPSLDIVLQEEESLIQDPLTSVTPTRTGTASGNFNVSLYAGGAVKNSILAAKSRFRSEGEEVRSTEAVVFVHVVEAYMDVIRDRALNRLSENQVLSLQRNLTATLSRFSAGELTRTDVAQSESRLALARSNLRGALNNLVGSEQRYLHWVGIPPGDLAPRPIFVIYQNLWTML
jgi:outer membrane protein